MPLALDEIMRSTLRHFDKYDKHGAYHWIECDRSSRTFNPPLVARYEIAAIQIPSGSRVLDIGCGDGYLMSMLSRRGIAVTGVEVETTAISLAHQKLSDFRDCVLTHGSCYGLPFASASFDTTVMTDVIEHLDLPERALCEAARIVKPDGRLVITTPKWRADRMWDTHHVREFKPEELLECLKPYFGRVDIQFFWPLSLSNLYSTRVGWRLIRSYARHFPNPFLSMGLDQDRYGQILAVCTEPRSQRELGTAHLEALLTNTV